MEPVERQTVRNFLVRLADEHEGKWDGLMHAAEIPSTTAHGWRYGREPATPSISNFLRILRAADVLKPEAIRHLEEAARAATRAETETARLAEIARRSQEKPSAKRPPPGDPQ